MRVALLWAAEQPLTRISVRYERYSRGFRALGHNPVTVCLPAAAPGYTEPMVIAPNEAALRTAEFYRALRLDAAVVVTWLRLPEIVGALKAACPWVASVADSDGRVGARVFPAATLVKSYWQHPRQLDRLRAAKYWAQRYLGHSADFDRPVLECAELADVVAMGSEHARTDLAHFFGHHQRADLTAKLAVIPYPVDDCYLVGEVARERPPRIMAVGRWDDPQKDAPLLAASVRRVLAARPEIEFVLVGPGGESAFGPVARRYPQVQILGPQPPEAIAALLGGSRSLVMSSRWEGAPVVVNEALCRGCTLIAPASVNSVCSFTRNGAFGVVARARTAAGLATAILNETQAWDDGRRDPVVIAATWRPRFDPVTVCRQLLVGSDLS